MENVAGGDRLRCRCATAQKKMGLPGAKVLQFAIRMDAMLPQAVEKLMIYSYTQGAAVEAIRCLEKKQLQLLGMLPVIV